MQMCCIIPRGKAVRVSDELISPALILQFHSFLPLHLKSPSGLGANVFLFHAVEAAFQ